MAYLRSARAVLVLVVLIIAIDMFVYSAMIPMMTVIHSIHRPRKADQDLRNAYLWFNLSYGVGLILATPLFTLFSDLTDSRRTPLMVSLCLFLSVCACLFFLDSNEIAFYTLRGFQGAAAAGNWTVAFALVADCFSLSRLGTVMGTVLTAMSIGYASGPPIGSIMYEAIRNYSFIIFACLALIPLTARIIVDESELRAANRNATTLPPKVHPENQPPQEDSLPLHPPPPPPPSPQQQNEQEQDPDPYPQRIEPMIQKKNKDERDQNETGIFVKTALIVEDVVQSTSETTAVAAPNADVERGNAQDEQLVGHVGDVKGFIQKLRHIASLLCARPMLVNFISMAVMTSVTTVIETLIPLQMEYVFKNDNQKTLSLLYLCVSGPGLVLIQIVGFICDHVNTRYVFAMSLFSVILALGLLYIANSVPVFMAILVFYGCAYALALAPLLPEMKKYLDDFDPRSAAAAYSLISGAYSVAIIVFGPLGTVIYEKYQLNGTLALLLTMCCSLVFLYGWYMRSPGWKAPSVFAGH